MRRGAAQKPPQSPPSLPFEDALLDGIPCKAIAWVESTAVPVVEGKKNRRVVEGVRIWRGEAVLTQDVLPIDWQYNRPIRYVGKIQDHDELREISAEVYVHTRSRTRFRSRQPADKPDQEECIRVSFTGAGNLSW